MPLSWSEYKALFATISRSTLLQSPVCTKTAGLVYQQKSKPYKILVNGRVEGLYAFSLDVEMLGGKIHGLIFDRGPLWMDENVSDAHAFNRQDAFINWLENGYPSRFGRRRHILPRNCEYATE